MRRGARFILIAAIVLAIVFALVSCAPSDAATSPGYVSGDGTVTEWQPGERPGPVEVSGTALDGSAVDITDYRGEVVVLNLWYAACPPCRAEAPDLVAIDALDGVQVVGINTRDDAATGQAFEQTFGVQYPSILGDDGRAIASLQGLVAVNAVPTTLVLDAEGNVAARIIGRAEASTFQALVEGASAS